MLQRRLEFCSVLLCLGSAENNNTLGYLFSNPRRMNRSMTVAGGTGTGKGVAGRVRQPATSLIEYKPRLV